MELSNNKNFVFKLMRGVEKLKHRRPEIDCEEEP